jgi:hypothetical protein
MTNPQRPAGSEQPAPHWLIPAHRETRWAALLAVFVAVCVQLALPERLSLGPGWLLPSVEGAVAVGLLIANPFKPARDSRLIRQAGLLLVAVMSLSNGASAWLLIEGLLHGRLQGGAPALLANGSGVYVTNIIAFALWYWELDRGGPMARANGERLHTDFLFAQMTDASYAPSGWQPKFLDYLYVSFTNATAFSPTDTLPLTRWAKMLMLLQSAIALVTVALVVARAVNIFQ